MLSDEEKAHIRAEEIFRIEVRHFLEPAKSRTQKFLAFLNSNLGLWIISAVFVSGISATYSSYSARVAEARQTQESVRRLDIEITRRLEKLSVLDEGVITFTQKQTARAAISGTTEDDPRVGLLGDFRPIFREFEGRSLFALIWELQRSVPSGEKLEIAVPLQESKTVENVLSWVDLAEAVGDEDSKWKMRPEKLKDFAATEAKLRIARWK